MLINDTATISRTIFKRVLRLMGNRFEISVVAREDEEAWANNCIDTAIGEIQRIEKLLTTYNENSQVNQINRYAGIAPVKVGLNMINQVKGIACIIIDEKDTIYTSANINIL